MGQTNSPRGIDPRAVNRITARGGGGFEADNSGQVTSRAEQQRLYQEELRRQVCESPSLKEEIFYKTLIKSQ